MAEEKEKKKSLEQQFTDISDAAAKRRAERRAARTKMRNEKAKKRRAKRKTASAGNSISGLRGMRGFYGSKQ